MNRLAFRFSPVKGKDFRWWCWKGACEVHPSGRVVRPYSARGSDSLSGLFGAFAERGYSARFVQLVSQRFSVAPDNHLSWASRRERHRVGKMATP